MDTRPALRACTLDAMGTLLRLIPPWEEIDPELIVGLRPAQVEAAFKEEMSYYAAHATSARDRASLAALRARCAEILSTALRRTIDVEAMMAAIRFEAFPETEPTLAELRRRGLRLACVSNWDFELPAVLERLGLATHFDAIVTSAEMGAAKPDPRIFAAALRQLGCAPAEALHVGDSPADVEGARAGGLAVLLIDRDGGDGGGEATTITSLSQISEHLRR